MFYSKVNSLNPKLLKWSIASRYLKSKRKESFISFISWFALIGIALGVAVLIIVMSVMNGFRKEIISSINNNNGHIFIFDNKPIVNYEPIIANLEKINDVYSVTPIIQEQVLIAFKKNNVGAITTGIAYKNLIQRKNIINNISKEALTDFKNNQSVILLGRVIARNLGVNIGDNITLISPNGYSTVMGQMPRFSAFKVVGIINSGMYQYDSSTIMIPLIKAQEFFLYGESIQKIEIFLNDPTLANKIASNIFQQLHQQFNIETWEDTNRYLMNALEVERNVMFLILLLVIIIATFNIVSGLIMLVRSKTKEIAILRTIGFSQTDVIHIFVLIGLRIGVIGTFMGAILGTLFSYNIESIRKLLEKITGTSLFAEEIYFLSKLPADVKSYQVILVIVIAIVCAFFASIYPAIKASKINPVDGIKYD
jgi:lipoprotein-releasing system permease protein